jgi:hypothetical protein
VPTWYHGHQAIRQFLVRTPLPYRWQHRPTRANGQLAVGGYLFDPTRNRYVPAVIDVLTLDGAKITAVTGFLAAEVSTELPPAEADAVGNRQDTPDAPARPAWLDGVQLFSRFGLPLELLPDEGGADQSQGHDQTFARR